MPSLRRRRPVLLYDGTCAFCRKCVALIACLDRHEHIARLNAHSDTARPLVRTISPTRRHRTLHLLDVSGQVVHGGSAASAALKEIVQNERWKKLLIWPFSNFLKFFYPAIAGRRAILGLLLAWAPTPPDDNFGPSDWPLLV